MAQAAAVVFGGLACSWGALVLPEAWNSAPIERMGAQIIDGAPYNTETLRRVVPRVEDIERSSSSRPSALHAAMLVRLRLLEDAIASGERRAINVRAADTRHSIDRLLQAAPTDAFAWLILFWVENLAKGFDPAHLKFLELSYRLGANEGWIAIHRSRLALGMLDILPPDLAAHAVAEFVSLVDSGFYKDAAAILMGPGWEVRDKILPKLDGASAINRQLLDRYMMRQGVAVNVPGVSRQPDRPWR